MFENIQTLTVNGKNQLFEVLNGLCMESPTSEGPRNATSSEFNNGEVRYNDQELGIILDMVLQVRLHQRYGPACALISIFSWQMINQKLDCIFTIVPLDFYAELLELVALSHRP
jgi:hypothetical protein